MGTVTWSTCSVAVVPGSRANLPLLIKEGWPTFRELTCSGNGAAFSRAQIRHQSLMRFAWLSIPRGIGRRCRYPMGGNIASWAFILYLGLFWMHSLREHRARGFQHA